MGLQCAAWAGLHRVCLAGLGVVVGCFGVGFLVVWLLFWFCGLGLLGLGGKVCEMSGSKRWLMNLDKKLFHRKKDKTEQTIPVIKGHFS